MSTQGGGAPATVAGHDATVHYNSGIPPEDFAHYAGDLAVTDTALASFFKILKEQQVSRGDLDSKLREIAGQYKELRTLLKTVGIEDLKEVIAEIIKRSGEAGDYAKVMEEVKKAGEAGDDAKVEELLLAMVEELLNQVEARDVQAIEKLEQAAKQRRISAEKINIFQAILQLGKLHYTKAGYYYRKAASLVPLENKWKRFVYLSLAGGILHFSSDNYKEALSLYEQSLSIAQDIGDKEGEMFVIRLIGCLYEKQGDLAKAEQYLSRAVEIEEVVGHPVSEEWHSAFRSILTMEQGVAY